MMVTDTLRKLHIIDISSSHIEMSREITSKSELKMIEYDISVQQWANCSPQFTQFGVKEDESEK